MKKLSQLFALLFALACFFESYGADEGDMSVLRKLTVTQIYNRKCKVLEVPLNRFDSIEQVKEKIKLLSEIPAERQYLMNPLGQEIKSIESLYENNGRFFLLLRPGENS